MLFQYDTLLEDEYSDVALTRNHLTLFESPPITWTVPSENDEWGPETVIVMASLTEEETAKIQALINIFEINHTRSAP